MRTTIQGIAKEETQITGSHGYGDRSDGMGSALLDIQEPIPGLPNSDRFKISKSLVPGAGVSLGKFIAQLRGKFILL